ncbi:helix-turn-helix transcriptional regulator [Variovorax sp. OV329]|uniref:helix-turn-helix transcriptional regulator n=1 Tax=Variovorax sp. OV329 TaxID=1882825 RepID=UPI0008E9381B|nr:LuxR C-terminal-related transcriptional regulator [Variovorax sp. OV329]SFM05080.1 DNA-binding transcriptional regulator, CsgD family [Variovorax sp. OV329]
MDQGSLAVDRGTTSSNSTHLAARVAPTPISQEPAGPGAGVSAVIQERILFDVDLAQAVLDHLSVGVALFGRGTQLLFINRAALNHCRRFPGLRVDAGALVLQDDRSRNEFLRALRSARDGVWSFVQIAGGAERLILGLRPARGAPVAADTPVLVTFGMRDPSEQLSIHFFARACGLSPAEAEVVRRLSEGLSPKEIARCHDVALSTVRTQLRCVRTKTGARNITELVRAVGCLPAMMPVDGSLTRASAAAQSEPPFSHAGGMAMSMN